MRYMQSWEIRQRYHDVGFQEGYDEGHEVGYGAGHEAGYDEGRSRALVGIVENAMKNFHLDLQSACEGIGTTVEAYEKAKLLLSRLHEEA